MHWTVTLGRAILDRACPHGICLALFVLVGLVGAAYAKFPRGNFNSPIFQGSPTATVTSITAGITCSRPTVVVPAVIQCSGAPGTSATASRADGSTFSAFEDLEYSFNFGDTPGRRMITLPTSGQVVDANSWQVSPEAGYIYDVPGSYVVTLNVRGKNGSGYTNATPVTTTITAQDPGPVGQNWGEAWGNCNLVTGSGDGSSPSNAFKTVAAINTYIGSGNNKRLHVALGSTCSGSTSLYPWSTTGVDISGLRIDTYNAGIGSAKPIFDITSGADTPAFRIGNFTPDNMTDMVVSNIVFRASGTATFTGQGIINVNVGGAPGKAVNYVYFDNVDSTSVISNQSYNNSSAENGGAGTSLCGYGFWGGSMTTPLTFSTNNDSMGIYANTTCWLLLVGVTITGDTGSHDTQRSHPIYVDGLSHALIWAINLVGAAPNRNYCVNGNTPSGTIGTPQIARYWSVTDFNCQGVQHAFDASGANNEVVTEQMKDMVFQRNAFNNLASSSGIEIFYGSTSHTWRDNRWWGNSSTAQPYFLPDNGQASLYTAQHYRNKFYIPAGTTASSGTITYDSCLPTTACSQTYTFTNGSSVIVVPSGFESYPKGLPIKFTGSPPSPFVAGTQYYVNTVSFASLTANITVGTTAGGVGADVGPASSNGTATGASTKWIAPQTWAYNTIVDARASGVVNVNWTFADMVANGSYVDFNSYFSTAGQTNLFADNGSAKTFAQWKQAGLGGADVWDIHGSVLGANPWPNNSGVPAQWSDMNFLLKRDMQEPGAANDNDPMFLEKAA